MNKKNKIRVAIVATLSVVAIVLGVIAFQPQNEAQGATDITPVRTPDVVTFELVVTPSPTPPPMPTKSPLQSDEGFSVEVAIPKQSSKSVAGNSNAWFALIVGDSSVDIAYGVDEETLEDTPGWLETSALPGDEGTCVIFGHRNRKHLKILKDVKLGETITIKYEGVDYSYLIESISILENEEQLTIPATTGKHIIISTCYPFHYSGSAPQKYVLWGTLE